MIEVKELNILHKLEVYSFRAKLNKSLSDTLSHPVDLHMTEDILQAIGLPIHNEFMRRLEDEIWATL